MSDTYNGWANYQTWNVALWIQNEEGIYQWAEGYREHGYKSFAHMIEEVLPLTPDGVSWKDPSLNIEELDEMMAEL